MDLQAPYRGLFFNRNQLDDIAINSAKYPQDGKRYVFMSSVHVFIPFGKFQHSKPRVYVRRITHITMHEEVHFVSWNC